MKASELNAEDYNPYYKPYIDTLGDVELVSHLKKQLQNFPNFMQSIPEEKGQYAYDSEKWTVLEVLQHIIDAERVFQYRALRFSRNDETALPGFDQDIFVAESGANSKSMKTIIEEYKAVRTATISLFASFDESILRKVGIASDSPMSVAALGFIICGHQRHHRNIIREQYL